MSNPDPPFTDPTTAARFRHRGPVSQPVLLVFSGYGTDGKPQYAGTLPVLSVPRRTGVENSKGSGTQQPALQSAHRAQLLALRVRDHTVAGVHRLVVEQDPHHRPHQRGVGAGQRHPQLEPVHPHHSPRHQLPPALVVRRDDERRERLLLQTPYSLSHPCSLRARPDASCPVWASAPPASAPHAREPAQTPTCAAPRRPAPRRRAPSARGSPSGCSSPSSAPPTPDQ